MMALRGFSHIGLSTLDLDRTRDFHEGVLGFKPVRCDILKVKEGGQIRHIFFDAGRDQLIAFMEATDVAGVPKRPLLPAERLQRAPARAARVRRRCAAPRRRVHPDTRGEDG